MLHHWKGYVFLLSMLLWIQHHHYHRHHRDHGRNYRKKNNWSSWRIILDTLRWRNVLFTFSTIHFQMTKLMSWCSIWNSCGSKFIVFHFCSFYLYFMVSFSFPVSIIFDFYLFLHISLDTFIIIFFSSLDELQSPLVTFPWCSSLREKRERIQTKE